MLVPFGDVDYPFIPGYLRKWVGWKQCWKCWLSWRPSSRLLWRLWRWGAWASWFVCSCTVGMFSLCYWRLCSVDLWRLVHLISVVEMFLCLLFHFGVVLSWYWYTWFYFGWVNFRLSLLWPVQSYFLSIWFARFLVLLYLLGIWG